METLKKFPTINAKVQQILDLNSEILGADFSQFNRALKLAKLVNEVVNEIKETAWNLIKAENPTTWKVFISELLNLSYSYISRLIQVAKLTPEHVSNYVQFCKENGITPDLLGLINFGKEKETPQKPELSIQWKGKSGKINKDGIFNTTLNQSEIKDLINYLNNFLGDLETFNL
jgi:hypothetical protein